jgi:hypothetical protein
MTPRPSLLGVSVLNYIYYRTIQFTVQCDSTIDGPQTVDSGTISRLGYVPCLCPCMDVVADEDHPDQISGV